MSTKGNDYDTVITKTAAEPEADKELEDKNTGKALRGAENDGYVEAEKGLEDAVYAEVVGEDAAKEREGDSELSLGTIICNGSILGSSGFYSKPFYFFFVLALLFTVLLFIIFTTVMIVQSQNQQHLQQKLSDLEETVRLLQQNYSQMLVQDVTVDKNGTTSAEPVNVKIFNISDLNFLDTFNSTLLAQELKITSMQAFLSTLEHSLNLTNINIEQLEQEMRSKNSLLTSQLENFTSVINLLSQSHYNHQFQLSDIQSNVSAISIRQDQVDGQLIALNQTHFQLISAHQSSTSYLTEQLTDAKRQVRENKENILMVKDTIDSLTTKLSQAQKDRNKTGKRVTTLEGYHSGTVSAYSSHFLICISLLLFCCV